MQISSSGGSIQFDNGIVRGNTLDQIVGPASINYCNVVGGVDRVAIIDLDPKFVDPDSGDFRLRADSPCIDTGNDDSVLPDAYDRDHDGDQLEAGPLHLDGQPRFVSIGEVVFGGEITDPIVIVSPHRTLSSIRTDPPHAGRRSVRGRAESSAANCLPNPTVWWPI